MSESTHIWIDAQLSPSLALWINETFDGVRAQSLRALGLRDASDNEIFSNAKLQGVVLMSKDYDFVRLLELHGPPPQLIWITCGNTSNARMRDVLSKNLITAIKLLQEGNNLLEISGQ